MNGPALKSVYPITRRVFCAGAAAVPLALAGHPAGAAIDFNTSIGWRGFDDGLALARAQSKPIFMLVHANWCPACKRYAPTFREAAVVAKLRSFVPVLVDSDHDAAARRYRPDGGYIPRSLILSSSGEHYADVTGPYDHQYFLPPSDTDYLLDYLDRGLARAGGNRMAAAQPVRRTAPGAGEGPSFSRLPETGQTGGGGPKRVRAPQAAAPSTERAAEAATAEPGLLERILGMIF